MVLGMMPTKLSKEQLEIMLREKRAELARVAPSGSAWGGIQHDRRRADELSQEIRGIELALLQFAPWRS